jgi:hypothetical protein
MAFFDKLDSLKEKAVDLAQSGAAKSKELAEIGKLKLNIAAEEDSIKKAYMEIGKLYYAERGMTPDAAYAALCEKITASKAVIEANNARIEEIKEDDDDQVIEEVVEKVEDAVETVEEKIEDIVEEIKD